MTEIPKRKQPEDKIVKGCLSFRVLRKLTNGYRTIKMVNGATYDCVGVDVEVETGYTVPICLEVLPNGLFNLYVISSNYALEQPSGFYDTVGKLVKTKQLAEIKAS